MINDFNCLKRDFFARPTNIVSQELLGKLLCFQDKKGIITETESYIGDADPACHAANGRTKRTEVMFGPAGFSYIYLIYGLHFCLNIVTEEEGFPAAVLIRGVYAISPSEQYLNGPGKLCKFFGLNKYYNNYCITNNNQFFIKDIGIEFSFSTTPRIGISKGLDKLWRYVIEKNNEANVEKIKDAINLF